MTGSETLPAPTYLSPADILDRARDLVPVLRDRAAEIEQARKLPADVVELLRGAGVFRMGVPTSWGGPGMTSAQQAEVIEVLATGDASAAWCVMIGMDSGIYSGFLEEPAARAFFDDIDLITAGWIHPQGRAERVPGGYRVSGEWRFGSGCTHCDRLAAGCVVYRDGEPEPGPDGAPVHWRVVLARPEQFEIVDTWFTTGLAGSGSRDYRVTDLFVPEEHSFSFYEPRREGPLHATPEAVLRKMSGVPLGVARAAIDHVRKLAETRVDRATGTPWAQSHHVRAVIGAVELDLAAARANVYANLDRQWERLAAGGRLTADERASTALARYHAFRTARSIVNRLYDLVGGASVYRPTSLLDRWLRDTNTMCQHAVAQDSIVAAAGELVLGGSPANPFI
ncbi:acyl-CoA dehydrogenase family protein [Saccharothrix obliqua]|uniref:acyl-CoA dehydrogenase family protein n=1 Tax=Saccharothrix obliqua TaxID=2861747 RepID=UPI001C5D84D7|nr:acyl-CoA dehydrogenase family protein [Saccharothrix obliqua]MBW4717992.1 acyl-CoA dehydrogenase family protein [Saccharothrix obliqua]